MLVATVGSNLWCLGGDMNCWPYDSDKRGGARFGTKACKLFNNWLLNSGCMEVNYQGPRFTWSRGDLHERLDWCLVNQEWMDT